VALAVPDDEAVEGVLCGSGLIGALADEAIVIVHSTILPATARRLAGVAEERAIGLLDAPVSGGAERALAGELTVMVGGEEAVLERARPVLEAVGSDVRHVGPSGAGSAVKLANQLMMLSALAGAHEALDLARAYDVDERVVLDAVATSTGDSWVARNWGFFDDVARAYDEGGTPVRERPGARTCGMWSRPPGPPTSPCPWPACWPSISPRGSRTTRAGPGAGHRRPRRHDGEPSPARGSVSSAIATADQAPNSSRRAAESSPPGRPRSCPSRKTSTRWSQNETRPATATASGRGCS
jgi:hypothetical protein